MWPQVFANRFGTHPAQPALDRCLIRPSDQGFQIHLWRCGSWRQLGSLEKTAVPVWQSQSPSCCRSSPAPGVMRMDETCGTSKQESSYLFTVWLTRIPNDGIPKISGAPLQLVQLRAPLSVLVESLPVTKCKRKLGWRLRPSCLIMSLLCLRHWLQPPCQDPQPGKGLRGRRSAEMCLCLYN